MMCPMDDRPSRRRPLGCPYDKAEMDEMFARRALTYEATLWIRRVQLMVFGGAVCCAYMLNVCVVGVFAGPSHEGVGNEMLLRNQLCMRTAFHALLVVGVTGLYNTTRNRVWLLLAWTYLISTSLHTAAVAALALVADPARNWVVAGYIAAQVAANACLLVAYVRMRLAAREGDDDALPNIPPVITAICRGGEARGTARRTDTLAGAAFIAVAAVFVAKHVAVIARVCLVVTRPGFRAEDGPWRGLSFADWTFLAMEGCAVGGHTAVSGVFGLFAVVKNLPHAAWAYALVVGGECYAELVPILTGATGADGIAPVLDYVVLALNVVSCAAVLAHAAACEGCPHSPISTTAVGRAGASSAAGDQRPEEAPNGGEDSTATRSELGLDGPDSPSADPRDAPATLVLAPAGQIAAKALCCAHAFAWYAESLCAVWLHQGSSESVLADAVAAGVGGTHGAILLGVQLMHASRLATDGCIPGREHTSRRAFHVISSLLYLAAAVAACLGRVVAGPDGDDVGSMVLLVSSVVRLTCTGLLACMFAFPVRYVWRNHLFPPKGSVAGAAAQQSEPSLRQRGAGRPGIVSIDANTRGGGGGGGVDDELDDMDVLTHRSDGETDACLLAVNDDDQEREGGRNGTANPSSMKSVMRRHQRGVVASAGGVVLSVCILIIAISVSREGGNGFTTPQAALARITSHAPAHALSFHFTFLFAIHVLVGALFYRLVSITFIRLGTLFVVPLLIVLCVQLAGHGRTAAAPILAALGLSLTATAVYLGRVYTLCTAYPMYFTSGNVPYH